MKNIYLILIIISCNQENKLITNNSIGYYKLGKKLLTEFDKKVFDITLDDEGKIRSIIVKSINYKTKDGFGVGTNLNDLENFDKASVRKPLTLSKGAVSIGNLGTGIIYDMITFVDVNDDGIVDYVLIQLINT